MTPAQERADKAIKRKLQQAAELFKECEELAAKHKVDFCIDVPGGSYVSFDGTGAYSDDGTPTGWDHSQC